MSEQSEETQSRTWLTQAGREHGEALAGLLGAPPERRAELVGSEAFQDAGLAEALLAEAAALTREPRAFYCQRLAELRRQRGQLALAWCHATLGEARESRARLESARFLYPILPEGGELDEEASEAVSRLRCWRRDPMLALGYWPPALKGKLSSDEPAFDPLLELETLEMAAARRMERLESLAR